MSPYTSVDEVKITLFFLPIQCFKILLQPIILVVIVSQDIKNRILDQNNLQHLLYNQIQYQYLMNTVILELYIKIFCLFTKTISQFSFIFLANNIFQNYYYYIHYNNIKTSTINEPTNSCLRQLLKICLFLSILQEIFKTVF